MEVNHLFRWDFKTIHLPLEEQKIWIERKRFIDEKLVDITRLEADLSEKAIRNALIALGWTPPGEVTVAQALEAVERLPSSAYRSAALDELTDLQGYLTRTVSQEK